jgi:CRP/FNR family cyclic AMP-dependent transcriptional regulator
MRKEFRFFNSLSDRELDDFLGFCETRQMPAGKTLWQEGDQDNYAAFIVSGRLGIKKKTEFAGKHVIVGTYEQGSVVGELCLLTDNARSVTTEILEPADLVILSSEKFEDLVIRHPALGLKLLKNIFLTTCRRLNKSYDRIAAIF